MRHIKTVKVKQLWSRTKDEWEGRDVPARIFHDNKRRAIRDRVRSGVSEQVAIEISGHKTRDVSDRYNIVSDQDLKEVCPEEAGLLREARCCGTG